MNEALNALKEVTERILKENGLSDVTYQSNYKNINGTILLKAELFGPPESVAKAKVLLGIKD